MNCVVISKWAEISEKQGNALSYKQRGISVSVSVVRKFEKRQIEYKKENEWRARKRKCSRKRVYVDLCTFHLPPNPDRADLRATEIDKGVLHKINKANISTPNVDKQKSKRCSSDLFVALAIQIYVEVRGQGIVGQLLLNRKNWNRVSMAQLVEHRLVMREVVSTTPAGPTLRVLK